MGETGCGKTRLIRYMCDIIAQGCKRIPKDSTPDQLVNTETTSDDVPKIVRNMIIMKVSNN